jgi:hypothetical protein
MLAAGTGTGTAADQPCRSPREGRGSARKHLTVRWAAADIKVQIYSINISDNKSVYRIMIKCLIIR